MKTIIEGGTIVNEGRSFIGSLVIDNDRIISVTEDIKLPRGSYDKHVDATGLMSTFTSASPGLQTRLISEANRGLPPLVV